MEQNQLVSAVNQIGWKDISIGARITCDSAVIDGFLLKANWFSLTESRPRDLGAIFCSAKNSIGHTAQ